MNIVDLLLGATVGVFLDKLYQKVEPIISKKISERSKIKIAKLVTNETITNWLLHYYKTEDLYRCTIGNVTKDIPFFVKTNWIFEKDFKSFNELIKEKASNAEKGYEINEKIINKRIASGQILFNNPSFYVSRMAYNDVFSIEITKTQYYKLITKLIDLEDEITSSIIKGKNKSPVRDAYFSNFNQAIKLELKPLSIGVTVGFVFAYGNQKRMLVQTRSSKTVTFGGAKALFPCFGLAPIDNSKQMAGIDIVYFNFIKEYLEEFFDYEELIDKLSETRIDPYWFMELPEAEELNDARLNNTLQLVNLGYGIDALNGTTTLSLLAELSDEVLGKKILNKIVGNWEIAKSNIDDTALELLPIDSEILSDYLLFSKLNYSSAFTIERIQDYYNKSTN